MKSFKKDPNFVFVVNRRHITYASVCIVVVLFFSITHILFATTPNPGHPWTEVGDGTFVVTGPSVARTYTFPDAATTVLTTNSAVTVAQGGTGLATLTANNVIVGNGTSNPTFVAPSTAGNLLESNGTTWTSATGGVLTSTQTLTSGTTYTPTAGTNKIWIRLWGAGGAGGSCTAVAGCACGGGGSGGYAEYFLTGVTGTYTYAIGTGGTAVAGATGNVGGNTTFTAGATTITAFGGAGGTFKAGTAATKYTAGGAGGVVSTNGHVNAGGVPGGLGGTSATVTIGASGYGGATSLGGAGIGQLYASAAAAPGAAALANTGSGGSGGGTGATTVAAGGAGGSGLIVIMEYR